MAACDISDIYESTGLLTLKQLKSCLQRWVMAPYRLLRTRQNIQLYISPLFRFRDHLEI